MCVRGWPFIFKFPGAKIEIGDDVTFNSHFLSNLGGMYQRFILVAKRGATIKIGDRVGISGGTLYAWDGIEIGDDTLVGINCKIMDSDFHPVDPIDRYKDKIGNVGNKKIAIGRNCFIGMSSILVKGTVIGDNVTVGAGSVVHGTIPPNCVVAGNPAKIIKTFENVPTFEDK